MAAPDPFDRIDPTTDDPTIDAHVDRLGMDEVVRRGVHWLQERFDADAVGSLDGVIQWEVTGGGRRQRWQIVVASGACAVVDPDAATDDAALRPHVTLASDAREFVRVVSDAADLMERFTAGHVLIAGNLPLARALASWFPPSGS